MGFKEQRPILNRVTLARSGIRKRTLIHYRREYENIIGHESADCADVNPFPRASRFKLALNFSERRSFGRRSLNGDLKPGSP